MFEFRLDKVKLKKIMSQNFFVEFNNCLNILEIKIHQENMQLKKHSLHCIIHKYLGFFIYLYNINEIHSSNGKFACDFDWQQMNSEEYNVNLAKPCAYTNINFIQYEQRAIHNLHHFNCKLTS